MSWWEAVAYCKDAFDTHLASLIGGNLEERDEIASLCGSISCWVGLLKWGSWIWLDLNDYDQTIANWKPVIASMRIFLLFEYRVVQLIGLKAYLVIHY